MAAALLIGSMAFAQSSPRFDGKWLTKLACPAKGSTEGYTWQFASVVQSSSFRGEHGTAGEPGYLLIEGKIAEDGSAKLSATGIVASRTYARGVFAHKGEDYSYNIKAKFQDHCCPANDLRPADKPFFLRELHGNLACRDLNGNWS
jgi:hypothetical protein